MATQSSAAPPTELGYWWRLQNGNLPAPPTVPEGGLWVAADPSGPMAVSALRFKAAATLSLKAADTSGTPDVVACAADPGWKPAQAGAWDDRVTAACETPRAAKVDGDTYTWDVTGLTDVALMPRSGSFSVAFNPPDAAALTPPPAADTTPAVTPTTTFTNAPPPAPDSQAFASPPAGTPSAVFDSATPAAPVVPFAADAPTNAPVLPQPVTPSRPKPLPQEHGDRAPLAVVAALVVAGAWVLRTRTALLHAKQHSLATPLTLGRLDVDALRDA